MVTPSAIVPWVAASRDTGERELRQAVHTVLVAISKAPRLPKVMAMKGGILLALHYQGDRYTRDIDFSTKMPQAQMDAGTVEQELGQALTLAVESLDYGLDCRIQSCKLNPSDPASTWPTLTFSIGYAPKADPRRHRRLLARNSSDVLSLDLSYNEVITAVDVLNIAGGETVQASTLADLVAEKFRAVIQQPIRGRTRRQDVYDLFRLLEQSALQDPDVRRDILSALRAKATARKVPVSRESLSDPNVVERSAREYDLLKDEIASELPEFGKAYAAVRRYYESLPW